MATKKLIKTQQYYNELNKILDNAKDRKEVAKLLGVTLAAVSNWFTANEKFIPSYYNATLLQKFYGAKREILRGKKDKKIIKKAIDSLTSSC